jgi:hypothetical protein
MDNAPTSSSYNEGLPAHWSWIALQATPCARWRWREFRGNALVYCLLAEFSGRSGLRTELPAEWMQEIRAPFVNISRLFPG